MPLVPSFTINAINPIDPSAIALVDSSTGADNNIVSRQVLLQKVDNSLLVPALAWPLASPSISYAVLPQDVALNVTVKWLAADGVTAIQTTSQIFAFRNYTEQFLYQLQQLETSNPFLPMDTNFYDNKQKLRMFLDSAINAISTGADIYGAQSALLKAINMTQLRQIYFNA